MNPTAAPMPLADDVAALVRRIDAAPAVAALAGLAADIRGLAAELIGQDAGAGFLTRVVSGLNERLTARVIGLVAPRHRLPAAGWCWLTMGSEGRGEQTFVTDQDNGLVFSASDHAEARALRPLFLGMAGEVNQALAACGFPLCEGGIMAGNAQWCLSVEEWRQHFSHWILTPEPEALLNATIFFDLRPLCGDVGLAGSLRQQLQRQAPQAAGFLHMMATNAVSVAAPLGRLRDFVDADGHKGCVDLKKHGSRLFVDAARVLALAAGAAPVATVERLRAAAPVLKLNAGDVDAALLAFRHVQRIRLLDQHRRLSRGEAVDNLVATGSLNGLDRKFLVDSLKEARRLQFVVQKTFRLESL
ncbi:MAG: hypothetical protein IPN12_15535 [Rhodocyclaceae bacterium]|nr:hypothetical protein [Rhodocyclaceae bacterium]MBK6552561.1 hypothetical protein [Rhodocyclaceae bacterium]MBK9312099.1 hypothetical protein [Rhodocyclaceae bacterium]